MEILAVIKEYCKNHRNETHARIASLILEENSEVEYSHRHLRRLVGRERTKVSESNFTKDCNPQEAIYTYKGSQPIHSLKDALEYFEIDVEAWEVDRYSCNSWEAQSKTGIVTLYQVKLILKKKEEAIDFDRVVRELSETVDGFQIQRPEGTNTCVLAISDLHIGAKVDAIGNTPDFSIKHVIARLQEVATAVNNGEYASVHVCLLGDYIESFTGLNHASTWMELEHHGHGTNVVITAYTILRRFLTSLNNVESVYMVSGNHDRVTKKLEGDPLGSVASMLAFMLKENTSLDIRYNPLILTVEVDGIYYLLTHNHYNISKGDMGKVFWEYGKQGIYNVLLGGHWHARKGKRVYKTVEEKHLDQANYRQIAVAPLFTGNFYSESHGWNSTAGYTVIENNTYGKPNVFEYVLS